MRPHRQQHTKLHSPWDSPGKNTGVGCHFLLQCMKEKSESEVSQSCPTLRDPMDRSPPGSSVHGICQARALEWGAIALSMLIASSINSAYSLEGLMLKLKHPCFGHLMQRADSLKKRPQCWERWKGKGEDSGRGRDG